MYLVISFENFCIYTVTTSPVIANAISEGLLDSFIRGVDYHNSADFSKIKNRNFFIDNIYQVVNNRGIFKEIVSEQITDTWKNTQKIVIKRQDTFAFWETYVNSSLSRTNNTSWGNFDNVALNEIQKCKPEQEIYTPMIEEYANVTNVTAPNAYKQLKLKIETNNFIRFRVTALAEKWKNKINEAKDDSEFDYIKSEMIKEFWSNVIM
jgi:hypothetical protein